MTEIEKKALELVNDVCAERGAMPHSEVDRSWNAVEALCRAIEQHEAYKQEVSDAVVDYFGPKDLDVILAGHLLERFIIPKPTVDPLAAALAECEGVTKPGPGYDHDAKVLRAALAKRGLKIVEDV